MLKKHHCAQPRILERWVHWHGAVSLDDLVRLTQDYQTKVNRYFIDRLRFYKYRPTGGVLPFMLHDPHPAISWSVVDYWREPKRSYEGLKSAFSPQYIFALISDDIYTVSTQIDLPIYVVNDSQQAIPVTLQVVLFAPDGNKLANTSRALTLPPDCTAVEVERLRLVAEQTGTHRLVLRLDYETGASFMQEYDFVIVHNHA